MKVHQSDLETLDTQVEHALKTGDPSGLTILGYGEISCVLQLDTAAGSFACKRLPPFETEKNIEAYRRVFNLHLEILKDRGIRPVDSELRIAGEGSGGTIAYCIQPLLPNNWVGPLHLAYCPEEEADRFFQAVLDSILKAVNPVLGLDGQISNWVADPKGLKYLDVTTPLLRERDGSEMLDTELFIRSMPPVARAVARKLFLAKILDNYHDPRGVILDLLANLIKENLTRLLPRFTEMANSRLDKPIRKKEIKKYYRSDAKMWRLLQRMRRLDRWIHKRIRRRTYPFLLPGKISRNL